MGIDRRVRVLAGPSALDRAGEEAAALGSRSLVVSAALREPREEAVLAGLRRALQAAGVGQQQFPRVPRDDEPLGQAAALGAEGAREGRCRLVIGVGDDPVLDVARAAAGGAWLPSLVVPTVLGYGRAAASDAHPLPDVLILDPAACGGSPPRRTASRGVALLAGLLEAYAGDAGGAWDAPLEQAMRGLVDELPRAVGSPDDPAPRAGLAAAVGQAAEGMALRGSAPAAVEPLWRALVVGGAEPDAARAALLPAAIEVSAARGAPLRADRVARFGRQVLGIREADDGRAAQWAAGGVRQWLRNLGFAARLVVGEHDAGARGETMRAIVSAMRR
jgi:alcohol dehydrogenase class IV